MDTIQPDENKITRIIKWTIENPWKTIMVFLGIFVLMVPFLSQIKQDFSYRAWFDDNDKLLMEYDSFEKKFGNDDTFAIIVHSPSGIFDKDSIQVINEITEKSWSIPEVTRVDSITNYNWVHNVNRELVVEAFMSPDKEFTEKELREKQKKALNDEILPGYLISPDAKTSVIYLTLRSLQVDFKSVIKNLTESEWNEERSIVYSDYVENINTLSPDKKEKLLNRLNELRVMYYKGILNDVIAIEQKKGRSANCREVLDVVDSRENVNAETLLKLYEINQSHIRALHAHNEKEIKNFKHYLQGMVVNTTVQYENITGAAKKLINEYRTQKGDHEIYYTGSAPLNDYFRESSYNDLSLILPLVLILVIVLLFVTVRRLTGVVLSIVVTFLSIILGMASLGALNFVFKNITLNAATMGIPVFLMAIGIADSVHIVVGVNHFLKSGLNKNDAILESLKKNFGPTLLTSISTGIGFFSFASSQVIPIGALGIAAGIGSVFAWGVTYFILGPLLIIFPYGTKKKNETVMASNDKKPALDWGNVWGDILDRNKKMITFGFSGLAVIAMVLALLNHINSDPYKYFRETTEIRKGLAFIEEHVGSPMTVEISIKSGEGGVKNPQFLHKVEQYEKWIRSQKNKNGERNVTKTISITDVIREMNFALNEERDDQYRIPDDRELIAQEILLYSMNAPDTLNLGNILSEKEDFMRLLVLWKVHDSTEAIAEAEKFKKKAKELGLDVTVTGKMGLWHSLNPKVVNSFFQSIIIAVFFISILLLIVFRSVELGFYALITNLMPLFFGGAVLKLIGRPLDMGTVVVFSVGLGIAVDDTIHFLFNYKRLKDSGEKIGVIVKQIFSSVGIALISTTVILVGSFSMYMMGSFLPNANFGFMLATILSFALITDMMFLPAFLMFIKKDSNVPTQKEIDFNLEADEEEEESLVVQKV